MAYHNKNRNIRQYSHKQNGVALLIGLAILIVAALTILVGKLGSRAQISEYPRRASNLAVLNEAKAALIGYAITYPELNANRGPGRLPCPDITNNGAAGSNCSSGGETTVGRFPFETLELPELRDEQGERLWYVVANDHRVRATEVNSNTTGNLSVDGQPDIVAVIFAPGAPVAKSDGTRQNRAGDDLDFANYLEGDNAVLNNNFVTRAAAGEPPEPFNDTLVFITRQELMAAVERRVLADVETALTDYQDNPNHTTKAYPALSPFADPATSAFRGQADPDNANQPNRRGHLAFHSRAADFLAVNPEIRTPFHRAVARIRWTIQGVEPTATGTVPPACLLAANDCGIEGITDNFSPGSAITTEGLDFAPETALLVLNNTDYRCPNTEGLPLPETTLPETCTWDNATTANNCEIVHVQHAYINEVRDPLGGNFFAILYGTLNRIYTIKTTNFEGSFTLPFPIDPTTGIRTRSVARDGNLSAIQATISVKDVLNVCASFVPFDDDPRGVPGCANGCCPYQPSNIADAEYINTCAFADRYNDGNHILGEGTITLAGSGTGNFEIAGIQYDLNVDGYDANGDDDFNDAGVDADGDGNFNNIGAGDIPPDLLPELPAWFVANDWQQFIYLAYAPGGEIKDGQMSEALPGSENVCRRLCSVNSQSGQVGLLFKNEMEANDPSSCIAVSEDVDGDPDLHCCDSKLSDDQDSQCLSVRHYNQFNNPAHEDLMDGHGWQFTPASYRIAEFLEATCNTRNFITNDESDNSDSTDPCQFYPYSDRHLVGENSGSGYRPVGDARAIILATGQWRNVTPNCVGYALQHVVYGGEQIVDEKSYLECENAIANTLIFANRPISAEHNDQLRIIPIPTD